LLLALAGLSASCLFMATVRSGPALLLGFFLLRSIGPGILSMLATNTLAAWFDRYLGTASSIMQVSMAATIALGPAALFALIQALGWRETYVLLSGVVGLGVLPLFWHYYRDRPPVRLGSASASQAEARWGDAGGFTLREALRTRVFWVLLAAIGVWSLIGTALMFHVEVIFAERNADLQQSAWASTAMAGAMAALQLGGGFLADRFSVRAVLSAGMLLIGVGCAAAAAAATGWQLLACYVIYGAGQGLMSIAAATGWPRFFGRSHLGAIRGAVTAVAFALSSLGPLAVGLSADYLQGTSHSLWAFAGSALLLAALGAALLPARNAA
jgi:MFS family permease